MDCERPGVPQSHAPGAGAASRLTRGQGRPVQQRPQKERYPHLEGLGPSAAGAAASKVAAGAAAGAASSVRCRVLGGSAVGLSAEGRFDISGRCNSRGHLLLLGHVVFERPLSASFTTRDVSVKFEVV